MRLQSERRRQCAVGEARDSIDNYTPGESKYSDWQCQICGYSLPPQTYDPCYAARAHMRSHGQPGLDIFRNSTAANDLEFKARLKRNAARFLEKRLAARRDSFKAQVKHLNALLPAWSCHFVLAHGVSQRGASMMVCARCNVATSGTRCKGALRKASVCSALSEAERSTGWTLACSACATGPLQVDA